MATGISRNAGYSTASDGQEVASFAVNKRKELIVIDFWTQLVLEGRMFHIQIGTEDAPVDTTTSPDDVTVWMLVDGQAGTTYIPTYIDVWASTFGNTAETLEGLVEIDRSKARYSTGGTAYVPENMRTDRPRASTAAAAYVGTDITASAKSAVPASMEIARVSYCETTPSATNEPCDFNMNAPKLYSVQERPAVAVVGVGSIITHFGSGTADCKGYGLMEWAELPTSAAK